MDVSNLIARPCTLTRATAGETTDQFGNEIPTTIEVETVCELQQRTREEREDLNEVARSEWIVFFRATETVTTADTLTVDGLEYEFVGEPWPAYDPINRSVSHIEASVRRTAGANDGQ